MAEPSVADLTARLLQLPRRLQLLAVCGVARAHWDELCAEALGDSGRAAQVVARLGASADHPELVGVPETGHLKTWILRVL